MGETWSSACIWDHDYGRLENISPYSSFGQNLWLGGGSLGSPPDPVGPTNAWYNEVQYYDYETNGCSDVCGHYTQVNKGMFINTLVGGLENLVGVKKVLMLQKGGSKSF